MTKSANITTRIIAGMLVFAGLSWAFLLILSVFFLVGVFLNFFFIPGWLCFLGWILIAIGRKLEMPERQFWILSVFAHCWLLLVLLFFASTVTLTKPDISVPVTAILFAVGMSVIAAFLCNPEESLNPEQSSE